MTMTDEQKKELFSCLRTNMEVTTHSEYGYGGGYTDRTQIRLQLIADIGGEDFILSDEQVTL